MSPQGYILHTFAIPYPLMIPWDAARMSPDNHTLEQTPPEDLYPNIVYCDTKFQYDSTYTSTAGYNAQHSITLQLPHYSV